MRLVIIIGIVVALSCNNQKKHGISANDSINTRSIKIEMPFDSNRQETIFPAESNSSLFDTLITSISLKIELLNIPLDSFVNQVYNDGDIEHIYKYRNFHNRLLISSENGLLLDTIFCKESFIEFVHEKKLDNFIFNNFLFDSYDQDHRELIFFVTLTKPETDYTFPFYLHYSLVGEGFAIKDYIEEEI